MSKQNIPLDGCVIDSMSVVIVHYKRESDVLTLVDRLVNEIGVTESNIVLCDNGSCDEFDKNVRRKFPRMTLLQLENVGFGAAMNVGVAALSGSSRILLLTHEVQIDAECIRTLSAELDNESTGIVGPRLMSLGEGNSIWSLGGRTGRLLKKPANIERGERFSGITGNPARRVDWLDGSVVMVDRRVFEEVGGYSVPYFLYFEDVDFGWKVRGIAGKDVVCRIDAVAHQAPGGNLDQLYAVRNLLWLLRRQGFRFAYSAYVFETVLRILFGALLKPRGAKRRIALRIAGLAQGLRYPAEFK
ncbi:MULTISPECIES: glycosyltransferase family 2 protein [Rhodococcus]|uniref:Glycosyltransferase family 2 protein n=1 Tax=Rhodococcus oxybenzonivorans TaxID=1990687 RepID=A0AAE4V364_9NOCA|nr:MULTISPECIES: glycosyltransferase family 2 protein [Rhodococcus]MDV7243722.1 glycosyltransferase family 2 protein [Rhodococcus oxybenzonivorans]MDV7267196.1 glycosyltransferase family 2 protein [Rhodococcus oxybenzonivorans]MDV7275036.1 glycosyltransferase family 2 protein [Rhodococcus oxybenzonivorans]MDV7335274.1 glycosyltransferase family 2 protein [Rhodococcus oxybenzonivorans]MDV7345985.1 glycosyltransferase family 2 protein [Rhodococcus oxybenzonivorans]